jgi:hypothetical protein
MKSAPQQAAPQRGATAAVPRQTDAQTDGRAGIANSSPQALAQRSLVESIASSPRQVAQRQAVVGLGGGGAPAPAAASGTGLNLPPPGSDYEPPPAGFADTLRVPAEVPKTEPAPAGFSVEVTLESVAAAIETLADFKPARKLRYFVKGKYYPSNDIELTAEDRQAVIEKLGRIRAMIAGLQADKLGLSPKELQAKQGEFYRRLGQYVPYAYQMANLDILWAVNVDEDTGHYEYSPGGPRTCNITVLSMALEGLGMNATQFTGDTELMQMILEHQNAASANVDWAVDTAAPAKAAPESDRTIHQEARKDFKTAKIAALRFADFMQLAIIYYYLTAKDVLAGKKTGLNLDVAELKALKMKSAAAFDEKLDRAHELARSGILFSDNFPYYAQRLFGSVGAEAGSIHTMGKKELKALVKAGGVKPEQIEAYKQKALKVIPPLLQAGKMIEINRVGHFIFLADITAEGLWVKDVGSTGRKYKRLDWKTAYEEGWLHGYIAYDTDPEAGSKLDAIQAGNHAGKHGGHSRHSH